MKLVKYETRDALIMGYGPGPKGQPLAILAVQGQNHPIAVALDKVIFVKAPHKLRHKPRHAGKKTIKFESFMDEKLNPPPPQ